MPPAVFLPARHHGRPAAAPAQLDRRLGAASQIIPDSLQKGIIFQLARQVGWRRDSAPVLGRPPLWSVTLPARYCIFNL